MEEARKAALDTGEKSARHNTEILTLYTTYLTAAEGSETYTTALTGLAEALGLTAEEAANAKDSIQSLTIAQLEKGAVDAKAAMQRWNLNNGDWVTNYLDFNKVLDSLGQGFKITIDTLLGKDTTWDAFFYGLQLKFKKGDVESIVSAYETILKMQEQMNDQAYKMGVDVNTLEGYTGISKFLDSMRSKYEEALAMMNAYTAAESASAVA